MSRADYAHHNEDAERIWWLEEGRFAGLEPEPGEYDPYADEDEGAED